MPDPAGTRPAYTTLIEDSADDSANNIALDKQGDVCVAGYT